MATKRKVEKNLVEKAPKADSKVFYLEFLTPAQKLAWNVYQNHDVVFLSGAAGTGKAEPLDAIVYTPDGPKTMGEMKVGDTVCTPDGSTAPVLAVYPQGEKDIYKITFVDGDSVECCLEHLWKVDNYGISKKDMVVDTKYLLANIKSPNGRKKIHIKTPTAVKFNSHELLIPPYLLGAILGDGCFVGNYLGFTSADEEIVKLVKDQLGSDCLVVKKDRQIDYRVVGTETRNCLKSMGLWGKRSWEKTVPDDYIYTSAENRLDLLRGLMDTDGTVDKKTGMPSFCTTSPELAKSVKTIVQSLGGICVISNKQTYYTTKGETKAGRPSFVCNIRFNDNKSLFKLSRKQKIAKNRTKYPTKRVVASIECVGRKLAQCIHIGSEEHLYLTDNFIVTHNSHLAVGFALQELFAGTKQNIVITRPIVEAGENLGFLPGPQPLDARVLTPNGWVKMGDLSVGQKVISRDGLPTEVLGIYPKGKKSVYKITTTEGTSTECCLDHLWLSKTKEDVKRGRDGSVKTTAQIYETMFTKSGKPNHYIPRNEAVVFEKNNLPIMPYALGALIGDGCFGNSICLASKDEQVVRRVEHELSKIGCQMHNSGKDIIYSVKSENLISKKPARAVRLTNVFTGKIDEYSSLNSLCNLNGENKGTLKHRCTNKLVINGIKYEFIELKNRWSNPLKNIIEELGLLKVKASKKFIPDIYKYSSIEDRLDILRGLMDTDGSVSKSKGSASFTTVSPQLAIDVAELVRSLGGRAVPKIRKNRVTNPTIEGREISHNFDVYEFTISLPEMFNPFFLERKAKHYSSKYSHHVGIQSIEYVEEKEVQCILVKNPEHLYITDQYIVTHNTLDEKVDPYMMPLYDCLTKMVGRAGSQRSFVEERLEVAPLAYMRGRAIPNTESVLTPSGYRPMGEINKGDMVTASNGEPTRVEAVYPQGVVPVYLIKFSDHTESICCENHLWSTMTLNEKRHNKGFTVKSTKEIADTVRDKYNRKVHIMPIMSAPAYFESKPTPVDPYLLGCLLCKKSNEIFVPNEYKYNSVEVRLAVLRGLLDTDGTIGQHKSGKCRVQFTSTSKQLADDVMFLVRSLGGYASCRERTYKESDGGILRDHKVVHKHNAYVVDLVTSQNPFLLPRKADKYINPTKPTKMITAVDKIGEMDCTCIRVAAPDHLFVIRDFVVTHNTFEDAVCILDEAQNCTMAQLTLFLTRLGNGTKMIVTGDPNQSDLFRGNSCPLADLMAMMSTVDGIGAVEFPDSAIVRHPLVGKILRRLKENNVSNPLT